MSNDDKRIAEIVHQKAQNDQNQKREREKFEAEEEKKAREIRRVGKIWADHCEYIERKCGQLYVKTEQAGIELRAERRPGDPVYPTGLVDLEILTVSRIESGHNRSNAVDLIVDQFGDLKLVDSAGMGHPMGSVLSLDRSVYDKMLLDLLDTPR